MHYWLYHIYHDVSASAFVSLRYHVCNLVNAEDAHLDSSTAVAGSSSSSSATTVTVTVSVTITTTA
jgi:hypothetical protein